MNARFVTLSLLAGLLVLGTGASVDGVRQADDWQRAGDIALANHQPMFAYHFYKKNVETFPRTPHGRLAASRGNYCRQALRHPARVPSGESWLREIYDFLTW